MLNCEEASSAEIEEVFTMAISRKVRDLYDAVVDERDSSTKIEFYYIVDEFICTLLQGHSEKKHYEF